MNLSASSPARAGAPPLPELPPDPAAPGGLLPFDSLVDHAVEQLRNKDKNEEEDSDDTAQDARTRPAKPRTQSPDGTSETIATLPSLFGWPVAQATALATQAAGGKGGATPSVPENQPGEEAVGQLMLAMGSGRPQASSGQKNEVKPGNPVAADPKAAQPAARLPGAAPIAGAAKQFTGADAQAAAPGSSSADADAKSASAEANPPPPAVTILSTANQALPPQNLKPFPESGMSPASKAASMQVSPEMNESSGLTEQNLPRTVAITAISPASGHAPKEKRTAADDEGTKMPTGDVVLPGSSMSRPASAPGPEAGKPLVSSTANAVERSLLSLSHIDNSSVSFVLKPDSETQIALHVRCQHGQMQAVAVLEKGNSAALSADWSQLQGRLAEQGIRLAPLATSQADFGGSGQQQRPQATAMSEENSSRASITKKTSLPRSTATANRASEWWA